MNRSRGWCFTLNNYSVEEEETIRNAPCAYMLFGRERGDEGTPHLQGYVHFKNEKSLKQLKALMPRAHVEARKGTIQQAIEYCQKEGDWEEHGKPKMPKEKGEGEKKRWRRIFEKAEEGDEDWLKENEPNVAFKHMATFRSHKKARKNRSTTLILRMNGGSVQPELASPRRYGKSTQLTMLKRRTSGGATTRDKTRS